MTGADVHAWFRLLFVVLSAMFLLLLVRSLSLAYIRDYGWPRIGLRWPIRRSPFRIQFPVYFKITINGRSELDREVLIMIVLFAILAVLSIPSGVTRVLLEMPLPITYQTIITTAYTIVFARSSYVIWRIVRRYRLARERGERMARANMRTKETTAGGE